MDNLLLEDEICVSKYGARLFLKHYRETNSIDKKPGSGLPPKLSPTVQKIIDEAMCQDGETTATQLHALLAAHHIDVSLATIVRNQCKLCWIYRCSAYCQLIRQANEIKCLQWAQANVHDIFDNVIWGDETTVQLENHRRFCYRKDKEKPRPKPRPKHPIRTRYMSGQACVSNGSSPLL